LDALGTQLLLEFRDCKSELLNDVSFIRNALVEAALEVGATIVQESFHQFSPYGVTGILAIAESHVCIHTWPEYGYAAVDIFTCGEAFEPRKAAQILIDRFHAKEPSIIELKRGILLQTAS
jgi:S-adenosylmethionine decarboxylase